MRPVVYISVDIESTGPYPIDFDLLQIGGAAFSEEEALISTFSIDLQSVKEEFRWHPNTLKWWSKQALFEGLLRKPRTPIKEGLLSFVVWLEKLAETGSLICVCAPVSFDFMWVYTYMMKYVGRSPFKHRALDLRSYHAGKAGLSFFAAGKRSLPKLGPHIHDGLSDAIEQGKLLFAAMRGETRTQSTPDTPLPRRGAQGVVQGISYIRPSLREGHDEGGDMRTDIEMLESRVKYLESLLIEAEEENVELRAALFATRCGEPEEEPPSLAEEGEERVKKRWGY